MHVTFDEAKDGLNQIKHGVALSEAAELEWGDEWIWKIPAATMERHA